MHLLAFLILTFSFQVVKYSTQAMSLIKLLPGRVNKLSNEPLSLLMVFAMCTKKKKKGGVGREKNESGDDKQEINLGWP